MLPCFSVSLLRQRSLREHQRRPLPCLHGQNCGILGITHAPGRSTLSYANKTRAWKLFPGFGSMTTFEPFAGTAFGLAMAADQKAFFQLKSQKFSGRNFRLILKFLGWGFTLLENWESLVTILAILKGILLGPLGPGD